MHRCKLFMNWLEASWWGNFSRVSRRVLKSVPRDERQPLENVRTHHHDVCLCFLGRKRRRRMYYQTDFLNSIFTFFAFPGSFPRDFLDQEDVESSSDLQLSTSFYCPLSSTGTTRCQHLMNRESAAWKFRRSQASCIRPITQHSSTVAIDWASYSSSIIW